MLCIRSIINTPVRIHTTDAGTQAGPNLVEHVGGLRNSIILSINFENELPVEHRVQIINLALCEFLVVDVFCHVVNDFVAIVSIYEAG